LEWIEQGTAPIYSRLEIAAVGGLNALDDHGCIIAHQ
jgi:hypothetical protein